MSTCRHSGRWPAVFAMLIALGIRPALAGVDVRISGIDDDERRNAFASLSLLEFAKRTDAERGEYDPADVQRLLREGEDEIRAALRPFGRYNATVTATLSGSAPDWLARYVVEPGPVTTVRLLDIEVLGAAADDPVLDRLRSRPWPLRSGRALRHADYESYKARMLQTAYGAGLLDARLTRHLLEIDVPANAADIRLTLDTGRRYAFGDVTIAQDGGFELRDSFLRRYLSFERGETYDPAKVLSTQFALSDLDYFETVDIIADKGAADPESGEIPIRIETTERAPRTYRFGGGFGTDTGPRALIGADFRRLNTLGHKLRTDLRLSQRISTIVSEYRVPIGRQPSESIGFTAQALTQNFSDVSEDLYRLGASYNRRGQRWQRRQYLEYTFNEYSIKDSPKQRSTLLVPGVSYDHSEGDDPIFPKHGWYAFVDVHGGSTALLSDTNFVQGLVKLRGVLDLVPRRLILRARADQGATWVGSFNNLPPSQRFFAGGDGSVRGYPFQSLGPRDANGRVTGGRYLTTASAELAWFFVREYGLAAFVDAGGAGDTPAVDLSLGAGLGFRYKAPFGAFALDFAHPFDSNRSPVRLHLGVQVGL